ncbi:cyclic nucleotide-binding domain protein (macronuclear) [Tetrahymena thermophila SB210]|uniref:Cyclic nucleotide-binding domain protein n=1 Tax=Tetrahymena thermophila (strain SB210) TaxID=312017 RepID=I7MKF0_TETTS|nr:cyclic nucleotide-binding domain protein [Tetrahymena thermophila SB210]EAR98304.2 cyclic nucleotide-binding domain protein [Tetrahymena thermophila SB210]|eukprot:XP_001018549.2 cyclic nucleotide-binding domain protein [Tetrahymena thermophila SB210]
MNPYLKQQLSQISSGKSFFSNENEPNIIQRRGSYKANNSYNQEDIPLISQKNKKQRNSINSILYQKNASIVHRISMQRNSRFTKVLNLQSSGILNRFRTKDWDVKNDYRNMSPFLSQLLEDRDKYEAFLNGQQQVRLNNDIDTEIVSYILRKAQKKRCEIDYVKRALKNINIFADTIDLFTSKDSENKLFEQFNIEFFPPQTEIIEINEFGENFYIILKGKVACFTPLSWTKGSKKTPTSAANDLPQSRFSNQIQNKASEIKICDILQPMQQETFNNSESILNNLYHDMKYTKSFKQGEYFGEISLLTKQKRTATMMSEDDVILLTITKKGFNLLLGTKQQQDLREKMKFLKRFPFLEILSNAKLLSLLHDIKEVDYPNNGKIVYQENDLAENIYLIKSGQVQISYKKEIKQSSQDQTINLLKSPKSIKYQKVPLIIKGPNTYFGEEDILQNEPRRTNFAEVISEEAVLYVVNFKNLMIQMKFFGGQNIIFDMFNLKKDWETNRKSNIEKIKNKFDKIKNKVQKPKEYQTNRDSSFLSSSGMSPQNSLKKDKNESYLELSFNSPSHNQTTKRSSSNTITENLNKSNQFNFTSRYNQEESYSIKNQINNKSASNLYNTLHYDFVHENTAQQQKFQQHASPSSSIQKSQQIQPQNQKYILTSGKSKKLIPILNLNQGNLSEDRAFMINSQDSELLKSQSPKHVSERNYMLGNQTEKPGKNFNSKLVIKNFIEDRKHSVDCLKKSIEIKTNVITSIHQASKQKNNNSNSFLMQVNYKNMLNDNKKEMISKYEKKQDIQTQLVDMMRSSVVQDTKNLVKYKKQFLNILQKRRVVGNYETFQNDYFQIPSKLLQRCLQQKKVVYNEFNPNSYFQTGEAELIIGSDSKKVNQQNYYNKFFNNLVKYVNNEAQQIEKDQK